MTDHDASPPPVSRGRYTREKRAREEAERLLEEKSRALFDANEALRKQAGQLERLVDDRTAELRDALAAAQKAGEMRQRFLAVMSHEIRTPLGGMLGMLDLLEAHVTDLEGRDILGHALAAGGILKRIVDDVLDFSKLDAGKMHFEREPVDVRALIDGIRVMLDAQNPQRARDLQVSIAPDVPDRFIGDATRVRQVIANLVDNAVKFSGGGRIDVMVRREHDLRGDTLRVDIRDQGPGLSEGEQARLFVDFSQIEHNLSRNTQGTGLGLAICKRIIEGQGGRIGVSSRKGAGATFWFELPLDLKTAPGLGPPPAPASGKGGKGLSGLQVLLAEDNPINRRLITAYLTRLGVQADLAENGVEAVERFDPARHDLILMDIAMPGMDGLSATRALRRKWGDATLPPVIALTAHVMEAVLDDCKTVGIDRVLSKPLSLNDLEGALLVHAPGQPGAGARRADPMEVRALPPGLSAQIDPRAQRDLLATLGRAGTLSVIDDVTRQGQTAIQQIRTAFAADDRPTCRAVAHELKGASGLAGLTAIADMADAIESGADHLDRESLDEVLAEISAVLDRIASELTQEDGEAS